jgi:hypothetical protein
MSRYLPRKTGISREISVRICCIPVDIEAWPTRIQGRSIRPVIAIVGNRNRHFVSGSNTMQRHNDCLTRKCAETGDGPSSEDCTYCHEN